MAIRAVPESKPDAKAGKSKPQSTIGFPYYDLDSAAEVAHVMYQQAGGACERAALAGYLQYANASSGSFLTRVAAARMFGFIEPAAETGSLQLTDRGRKIASPISSGDGESAKVEAFLSVPLFKAVFERFKDGRDLPGSAGLRNLFEQLGVVKARIVPTVRIMRASAEQAGFFKAAGNKRMIKPPVGGRSVVIRPAKETKQEDVPSERRNGNGGGGSGDDGGIPGAFVGLLRELPPPGSPLTAKRRKALVDAFSNTVDFVYPEEDVTRRG